MNSDDEKELREQDEEENQKAKQLHSDGHDDENEEDEDNKPQKQEKVFEEEEKEISDKKRKNSQLIPERLQKFGLIQNIREKTKAPLYRVCVTGGPCAGKTTALKMLQKELDKFGFKVYVVPETPTLTQEAGGKLEMAK